MNLEGLIFEAVVVYPYISAALEKYLEVGWLWTGVLDAQNVSMCFLGMPDFNFLAGVVDWWLFYSL